MRAWQITESDGLAPTEVEPPRASAGQVLIEVEAAGLCHTDVSHIESKGSHLPALPMTLGHESAGRITALGAGVEGWEVGDRVAVLATSNGPGSARDGGYTDQLLAFPHELVRVPAGVDVTAAAIATDAGVTSYRAVLSQGRVTSGMRVGIIGLGGLGMLGARLSVLQGAEVYASDPKVALHDLAAAEGVTACATSILDLAGPGFDVVVDFAGVDTTRDAVAVTREGGRVVQVGVGRYEATVDLIPLIMKQVELVGSATGSTDELARFLDLVATGAVRPTVTRIGFDEIGEGLDRLARGLVTGRLVATR